MDFLTHAFSMILLGGHMDIYLVCFGVIGTVLPDMDILMQRLSDTDPRLYIFSHGGITHSIAGSLLLSVTGFFTVCLMKLSGILSPPADPVFQIFGLGMMIGGALLHVAFDYLAYPGIPLFYPFSDEKYTLGIFPGPSIFLSIVSIVFLLMLITGLITEFADTSGIYVWGIVFFAVIAFAFIKKGFVAGRFRGHEAIPTLNPLHWIIVSGDEKEYTVRRYSLTKGVYGEAVYKKTDGVGEEDIKDLADDPDMKRLRYYSYLVVFEQRPEGIRAYDPLRVSGLIFYPPKFREYLAKKPKS
ncbi:metal-dependent hydrolase [Methanoplanus endosymbiosus]|uniref:Metal-dependent hydrolase n=1 Tax=Methanoplanus endosymbiosus TaxID=33865 RepID=A0A9E7PMI4_9EURY|nr:metal-dependent hydrolase [Methanoplanus endosymbiosus]UUX91386.1 metal-dependent hydrolase [Methanoplanus endosymbiosus]